MKHKIFKIIGTSLLSLFIILVIVTCSINIYRVVTKTDDTFNYLEGKANKVILFIGDGMGQNQIHNTELYLNQKLFFRTFPKQGLVNTYSKNTYWPTDSAASATAMATGKKVYNTHVGSDFNKIYPSISELAKEKGYGVGIVTTDTLCGATPASFSAHAKKRSNTEEIITSQLNNNIDLYLGAGYDTYSQYKSKFIDKGYNFISSTDELVSTNNKIIGSFFSINNYVSENEKPTLPELTEYAINYFETNFPNGYFIMIEGAHIDKSNHSNNINNMIKYLDEFDNSIELAYNKLHSHDNVCFIVTADHESGNLQLADDVYDITDELYLSTKHTKKQVYYFVYQNNNQEINNIPEIIDNTHIFDITYKLLSI